MHKLQTPLMAFIFYFLLLPLLATAACECESDSGDRSNKTVALRLKLAAIASILAAGAIGVCLPILGRSIEALRPEKDIFFIIKAFAAGVILATGMIHVLPDAFDNLTSPCLKENPWGKFPFAGFIAMLSAIGTLMVDAFATGYYKRSHFNKALPVSGGINVVDIKRMTEHSGHVHMHTDATHGHAHGLVPTSHELNYSVDLIRHSVVSQERFKAQAIVIMVLFLSPTTPIGMALGIWISSVYNENSPVFNSP